jgi:hypothetical protein
VINLAESKKAPSPKGRMFFHEPSGVIFVPHTYNFLTKHWECVIVRGNDYKPIGSDLITTDLELSKLPFLIMNEIPNVGGM